jgi:hypothetical protein
VFGAAPPRISKKLEARELPNTPLVDDFSSLYYNKVCSQGLSDSCDGGAGTGTARLQLVLVSIYNFLLLSRLFVLLLMIIDRTIEFSQKKDGNSSFVELGGHCLGLL